jgi:hypothetical protein
MTVKPFSGKGEEDSPANLWIGLLDLEILPGCTVFEDDDTDANGAAVYFVAMPSSEEEFREIAKESSERYDLHVLEMKEVAPLETWRKTTTDFEDYLYERAAETVKDGKSRFGCVYRKLKPGRSGDGVRLGWGTI